MPINAPMLDEFVTLAVDLARDDVTVPRHVALACQHLSPAEPLNRKHLARQNELIQHISLDDYPELDRQFEEALAKVTHFESGAPFKRLPSLVLHVGPGLARYCNEQEPAKTHKALEDMMRQAAISQLTGTTETQYLRDSAFLTAPEALRSETTAVLEVLRKFQKARQQRQAVLVVATFSQGVVSALLNALVDINLHGELAVVVHYEDANLAPTVHGMNVDGYLEDWPYGILNTSIDEDTLLELGFDVPHKD